MSDTKQFWQGDFGNEYVQRNRFDWTKRIPFWKSIIELTSARSVHEFGCNVGYNLSAIRRAFPDVQVSGNDVNESALYMANAAGIPAWNVMPTELRRELVFSCGVLIHIAPEDLKDIMQSIINASTEWVLAVEYFAPKEIEIIYRGYTGKLWKRDYGKLYRDMGLILYADGITGEGFDGCAWHLLRKP